MSLKPIKIKNLTEETKKYILKYIKTLELKKNNKLPSEEVLAEFVGVSRVTIRSALNELASEGIIFRKQGKGTFVNIEAIKMKVTFNPVLKFNDMITNSGYSPEVKLLEIKTEKSDKEISKVLNIAEGTEVIVADKMFYADNNPCAYCVDIFRKDIITKKSDYKDLSKYENSIFEFIYEKTGRAVAWDRVEILTKTNIEKPKLKDIFDCDDLRAFLFLKGINFDNNDEPLIYVKEYIDTDFIQFNMIRQRNIKY